MSNIEIEECEADYSTYAYSFTIKQYGNTYHGKLIHMVNEQWNIPHTMSRSIMWSTPPYALDYDNGKLIDQLFEFMSEE